MDRDKLKQTISSEMVAKIEKFAEEIHKLYKNDLMCSSCGLSKSVCKCMSKTDGIKKATIQMPGQKPTAFQSLVGGAKIPGMSPGMTPPAPPAAAMKPAMPKLDPTFDPGKKSLGPVPTPAFGSSPGVASLNPGKAKPQVLPGMGKPAMPGMGGDKSGIISSAPPPLPMKKPSILGKVMKSAAEATKMKKQSQMMLKSLGDCIFCGKHEHKGECK